MWRYNAALQILLGPPNTPVTYTHVIVHILIDPAKSFIDVSKETQTARAETNLDLNLVHLWVEFFL